MFLKYFFIKGAISGKSGYTFINVYDNDDASTIDPKTQDRYNNKMSLKARIEVKKYTLEEVLESFNLKSNLQIPMISIDVERVDSEIFSQAMNLKKDLI